MVLHTYTFAYSDTQTHREKLGTACRGHVEVYAAVAQPESRSTASTTSPLLAQGNQTPSPQPSHIDTPLRRPKCKFRSRNSRNTYLKREDSEREDGIPLRAEFGELFQGFEGFYFLTPLCFLSSYFVGLTLAPTCRIDGGSSEPSWPWPLHSDCAGAAGGCSGPGPGQRSGWPTLSGPVLMHWDYSGLSRPRAPQRAQEHTPKHRETVSRELFFLFCTIWTRFPGNL